MINDNLNIPKSADNSNYNSFKINTEESVVKEGNTMRNEDSTFNTKKKKKPILKGKDDHHKNQSNSPDKRKKIELKNQNKENEPKVNNIIIHINNEINTNHSHQQIRVQTVNQLRENEMLKNEENSNKDRARYQSPKEKFVELQIDNTLKTPKYHDRVLEAKQNKMFVNLNRLLFSTKCVVFYGILVFACALISIVSLVDIFISIAIMNEIPLFMIEIVSFTFVVFDTACRIYILKREYLSHILLVLVDISLVILVSIQIIRFSSQTTTVITLILHCIFCFMLAVRFFIVMYSLRKSLKRQEDVRQNVEEIINFSEMIEENPKKFEAISHKKQKKFTPAISFVEDQVVNKQRGLNLIKEEAKSKKIDDDQNQN